MASTAVENSESIGGKRKPSKAETNARVAHRHGKHFKKVSQNTHIKKGGNQLNSGTPSYNLQGHKRVPNLKATKEDQQAGADFLSEMQTLIPGLDPLKDGYQAESYLERRERLNKLITSFWIGGEVEFGMTWEEFCARSEQAEAELQSFVRLDPNEEMAIQDDRCADFLSSVGKDENVPHGTR